MKQFGKQLLVACCLIGALLLSACASGSGGPGGGAAQGRDYFPGGSPDYSWGVSQKKEDFANVEQAQSYSGLYSKQRTWQNITVSSRASGRIIGLQAYYPLHVRWKLKDGREFMLENIDIAAIMREYFKTNNIQLQWQRERRPKDSVGDYGPLLTHEVKDDTVRIKWVISTNHTPVDKRLTPSKAATKWQITDEEYLVTTLQGVPTQGIDFKNWYEVRK